MGMRQSYYGKCIKEQIGTLPAIVKSDDSKVRALSGLEIPAGLENRLL